MKIRSFFLILVLFSTNLRTLADHGTESPAKVDKLGPLALEERVTCQRAIEEVYLRHRIWPKDNRQPKPALHEVMPLSVLRAKVE